MPFKVG